MSKNAGKRDDSGNGGSERQIIHAAILILLAAVLVVCGIVLARFPADDNAPPEVVLRKQELPAVQVNSHYLSFKELDDRAQTFMEDDRRMNRAIPKNERLAMEHYRLVAARTWIYHQILLDVAVAKGISIAPFEEKIALEATERMLKATRGMTLEEYYAEGPLSPEIKRADARDAQLIRKLLDREVGDAIVIGDEELSSFAAEHKLDRKSAFMQLRRQKYNSMAKEYYKKVYSLAKVKSRAYPSLELNME